MNEGRVAVDERAVSRLPHARAAQMVGAATGGQHEYAATEGTGRTPRPARSAAGRLTPSLHLPAPAAPPGGAEGGGADEGLPAPGLRRRWGRPLSRRQSWGPAGSGSPDRLAARRA